MSNSRIDIYIYNIGRDFGEVQGSACDPRNLPGNFLGLRQRYINPRFSAINCHSTLSTSDRLWRAVRTTPNLRSQRRLVPKFRTLPNVTIDCFALNGKGRLRRQACPCWLLLIEKMTTLFLGFVCSILVMTRCGLSVCRESKHCFRE